MDYGKVLGRAWEITWRWKVLWILGFLASLGSGGGGGGGGNAYSGGGDGYDLGRWAGDVIGPGGWAAIGSIILGLLCLGLLIAIAVWVVSIIARGGLIAGVQQVEDEGATSFGQAWRIGASRFWTLTGIAFLAAIPFIILLLTGIVVLVVTIFLGVAASEISNAVSAGGIITAILFGGVFCCGMIILGIVLDQVRTYAERAAILEGLGWIEAFKRGWQVIKENLGPTIILWLIFLAIGLLLAAVIIGGLVAVALPFAAIFTQVKAGPWLLAPICCGGLLAILVFALFASVVETFTSATWTLAYRELTGLAPQAAVEAGIEV